MAGLIDRLDSAEWVRSGMSDYDKMFDGKTVRVKDLRDFLRGDKAREALAEAIREALGTAILWREMPAPLVTDAVVRVLTGEEGDRG
jgi:hypothetical protein